MPVPDGCFFADKPGNETNLIHSSVTLMVETDARGKAA